MNSLLPEACFLCEQAGSILCDGCRDSLPWPASECCPRCALPSPLAAVCGQCQKSPPAFDHCHALFRFAYPVDSVIHALKYRHTPGLARPLAQLLRQQLPEKPQVDALLAMPLSQHRLRERGYNQAHELARHLARFYHLPLLTCQVLRAERELHQAQLPLQGRAHNVKNVFRTHTALPARLALIDDVMTSGSSLHELAITVKQAGAVHVEAWILARTYPFTDR